MEICGKFGWDQGKRVYFCCLISKGKGRFLKLSDKHGLGKTHLSILSRETSLGRLGGGAGVLLLDVSDKMEIIDFLQPIIKQNCKKI